MCHSLSVASPAWGFVLPLVERGRDGAKSLLEAEEPPRGGSFVSAEPGAGRLAGWPLGIDTIPAPSAVVLVLVGKNGETGAEASSGETGLGFTARSPPTFPPGSSGSLLTLWVLISTSIQERGRVRFLVELLTALRSSLVELKKTNLSSSLLIIQKLEHRRSRLNQGFWHLGES